MHGRDSCENVVVVIIVAKGASEDGEHGVDRMRRMIADLATVLLGLGSITIA